MTNETQLAKYREDAQKVWDEQNRAHWVNMSDFDNYAAGYIRAKQENERAMKLAKFGAMVLQTYTKNGDITEAQVNESAKESGCMHDAKAFTVLLPNIEATIKELLK